MANFMADYDSDISIRSESSDDDNLLPSFTSIICSPSKKKIKIESPPLASTSSSVPKDTSSVQSSSSCDTDVKPPSAPAPFLAGLEDSPEKPGYDHVEAKRKVEKLSREVRKLSESHKVKKKVANIMSRGGILGIIEQSRLESDSEDDEKSDNPRRSSRDTEHTSVSELPKLESSGDNVPSLPTWPPLKSLFIHTPLLIEELYPPCAEVTPQEGALEGPEQMLLSENTADSLTLLITTQWLVLFYKKKRCPLALWQWLFQIMCLSCDKRLSKGAYTNMINLVSGAKASDHLDWIFFPSLADIMDALASLGIDKKRVSDEEVSPQANDDVFVPSPCIFDNFCRLIEYLKVCIDACPEHYGVTELEDFIVLVVNASLDVNLYQAVPPNVITEFVELLVRTIPSPDWACSMERLSGKLSMLSQHHHNKLHVARLITGTTKRLSALQMSVCRKSIELLFEKLPVTSENTNAEFARAILVYYYELKSPSFDYKMCYKMFSILALLSLFLNLSQLVWKNAKSEREFAQLLGALSDKVLDLSNQPERGLVKDMLIQMKLEFEGQKEIRKQTNLNAFVFADIS